MLIAATERGVCAISFASGDTSLLDDLRARFPRATVQPADAALEQLADQVVKLIDGAAVTADIPLDLLGTAFQQRVWRALRQIPRGDTTTYAELARAIGAPRRGAGGGHRLRRQPGRGRRALPPRGAWGRRPGRLPLGARPQESPPRARAIEMRALEERVGALPWDELTAELDRRGWATIPQLLTADGCRDLVALYDDPARFRSRVVMARHNFGRGEYQYFAHPLPDPVARLRAAAYPPLVPIASSWAERLGQERRFPPTLEALQAECRAAGQDKPTPLLLKYGPDDYNCLHQDLYGEMVFPLQLAILLSEPGSDFTGGELVLTEQRPRMQSRVEVVPLARGDAVIFAVNHRPVAGTRGDYRVTMRHGVSRVRGGARFTLGIIFHDAA